MNPAVSVVMPVHNGAGTLARAIRSVLAQSFRDFELIIVDDGSTDGSGAVARSFDDKRIELVRFDGNRGGNAARNEGVRVARARLIAFLDSDDEYLPHKLETVVAEFDRRPEIDLLVDSFVRLNPHAWVRKRIIRRNPLIEDQGTFVTALLTRNLWKSTPAITVRRHAILRAGGFDQSVRRMQDFDFLLRVSAVAKCASTDEVLWIKHWQPSSISAQDNMIPANIELCRRHPMYLANRAYRPGLAYILRLSLWRRLLSGSFAGAARDVRQLADAFGTREASSLLFEACFPRPRLKSAGGRPSASKL